MGEGIQITIPDFGDDDYNSAPTPFGRSAGGAFGFGGGFSSSGLDSPILTTPIADRGERSYFSSHSRVDSVASEDSISSATTRYTSKPFAHSSQSSIATTSTAFSKKPSFASIRNAFKSGKHVEPPPVPSLDHHVYPVLKNPFNRSTSSLNHSSPVLSRSQMGTTNTPSSPFPRPPTPGSIARNTTKSRHHTPAKSHQSQTGSIFHTSDGGSDYGHGYSSSPPPVPRMPNAFGPVHRSDTPPISDFEDDKIVIDPKTPSDYALHAVFMRFAASAESKIEMLLRQGLDQDPLLSDIIGAGVDPKFDETLKSLGKIAQKHAKPVVDSIMRWRRSQYDNVGSDVIRFHTTQPSAVTTPRPYRLHDIPGLLNERKSLAAIYIMCRALIAVMQSISKDALGDVMGYTLEETTFAQFRNPDLKLLTQSANHRTNADLYATLLGHIANVRFMSVTDRFLAELDPVKKGLVPKDPDTKYENLVRGLKHIQIKVWPPEAFEEGAEFLESLSESYANAHGLRLKTAFAETLTQLLHPIGKTAQAETNNPQWAKAIEVIYPKAREMMSKPRYWPVAFPLAITSLCVAPQSYFLKHWVACFEAACSKLKDKPLRTAIMNGIMRLVWTYLYRCQESASTTTMKLDSLMKHFFPTNRLTIFPSEDRLEPFIYIVHFILSRHVDYGRTACLELLQESAIAPLQQSGNIGSVLAPERISVAVQAILLSLHAIEKEALTPAWPSSSDFSVTPSWSDYPTSSEFVSASLLSKPGMKDFFDRVGSTLAAIAVYCSNAVSHMSVFDEQWSYARLNLSFEEVHNYAVRRHANGHTVAYPSHHVSQVNMLQTCFRSWPRCLHPSIAFGDALDMLLRGVVHVEPSLADVSCAALKRFMADRSHALTVLSRFTKFLFSPAHITHESNNVRLLVESSQILGLWVDLVDVWLRGLMQQSKETLAEEEPAILARCTEIEGAALFLLTHETQSIHAVGVKVIRILGLLDEHIAASHIDGSRTSLRLVEYLHGKGMEKTYLAGYDELLEGPEIVRLEQWRQSKRADVALRIADSTNDRDRKLWHFVFPAFLQASMEAGAALGPFRESVVASASRYHPTISLLAGLSTRVPTSMPRTPLIGGDGPKLLKDNKPFVDQWRIWVKILCSTATLSESHRPALTQLGREHTRAPSDASFERERLSTTRGLFRYLTPFLDSEYTRFRDAAVVCISSFPSSAYPQLLEDLSLLAGRQFYDDPRSKSLSSPAFEPNLGILATRQIYDDSRSKAGLTLLTERTRRQERLHSAVARIYYLTAPFLQLQRSAGRQAALANVLKFVRNTQSFLTAPEMRDNHTLQRLRRYFCGTVERLFDGLATLKDSDRFIPSNMHLTLYRLCEEWCQLGPQAEGIRQRYNMMQRAAMASASQGDPVDAGERFKTESMMLSQAAVGSLASLCQKAFFPPDMSSNSPTDRLSPEYAKPLTPGAVLDRINGILSSPHKLTQTRGKKALRSILAHNKGEKELLDESIRRAVVLTGQVDTSNGRFFEVISGIVCNNPNHGFSFSQIVCLGLSNLRHPLLETRRHAFNMLEAMHQQSAGLLALSNFEATVGSCASGTYVHAHRMISDFLAGEHPHQAISILAQFATWLPQLPDIVSSTNVTILILQSLEFWIPNIELMPEDRSGWSPGALSALYHLISLTLRYGQSHAEQILVIWTKLVESSHPANGHATVRFLLEHSHKVGSTIYIECAANIVACLCQTSVSRQIFQELCSVIEPARMLPTIEHKLVFPDARDMELWADLDALFAEEPRLSLGSAQFAWLFLTDVAIQRCWESKDQLPILLHALFTHLDHRIPFVRHRAQKMLFQWLRSWAPGFDELPDRSANPGRMAIKGALSRLEEEAEEMYWKEDESSVDSEPKMRWLASRVLHHLEPLRPSLREDWGSLALDWGTTCSIRATAFRSLQIFRALMPRVKQRELAVLLGRLSNTISASDENLHSFTSEILETVTALVIADDIDWTLLPQIFWCACASLSTTIQKEFSEVLTLVEALLTKIDLDDLDTVNLLLSRCPLDWQGSASMQPALLKGLRSSNTSEQTFKILQTLTRVQDDRIIDASGGRVRDLYTLSLPWCLQAMASDKPHSALKKFAEDISTLAVAEERQSIQKIMTSFAKGHFRTRDDFLRQSVSSLREHYGADHWTEIVTLLLGLVLNRERWLQIHAMQILKVLFQQRETRSPFELLGSELLMPLLRLLETDLAPQALEVLEEPMIMSGGPAAKHVLRMSMHLGTLPQTQDSDSIATVFGIPEESGWCIAQADRLRETCRFNVMAVFDTCSMPSRPSRIDFEPEVEALASLGTAAEEDLGGLVKDLHELTSFFQDDEPYKSRTPLPPPNRRLEARVAAILAKSTASDAVMDTPQTPFLDVFHIRGVNDNNPNDSDDSSDADSGVDEFIFDSPSLFHSAANGFRSH
ncbi:Cell morphogenesis protein PAG1 [Hypsizygus marmoreus]|uniref:Cell morphogenesis protein PAG1 n=1 Tax=Hypsizygus marmoreus TaxID=39966 RepID=A0A369K9X0_HYPMA|nr:Cell morphogenesis protein PAG1 [Hypsizygus marmoreus]